MNSGLGTTWIAACFNGLHYRIQPPAAPGGQHRTAKSNAPNAQLKNSLARAERHATVSSAGILAQCEPKQQVSHRAHRCMNAHASASATCSSSCGHIAQFRESTCPQQASAASDQVSCTPTLPYPNQPESTSAREGHLRRTVPATTRFVQLEPKANRSVHLPWF